MIFAQTTNSRNVYKFWESREKIENSFIKVKHLPLKKNQNPNGIPSLSIRRFSNWDLCSLLYTHTPISEHALKTCNLKTRIFGENSISKDIRPKRKWKKKTFAANLRALWKSLESKLNYFLWLWKAAVDLQMHHFYVL